MAQQRHDDTINEEMRKIQNQIAWEVKCKQKNDRVIRFQHQQIHETQSLMRDLAIKIREEKAALEEQQFDTTIQINGSIQSPSEAGYPQSESPVAMQRSLGYTFESAKNYTQMTGTGLLGSDMAQQTRMEKSSAPSKTEDITEEMVRELRLQNAIDEAEIRWMQECKKINTRVTAQEKKFVQNEIE